MYVTRTRMRKTGGRWLYSLLTCSATKFVLVGIGGRGGCVPWDNREKEEPYRVVSGIDSEGD